MDGVPDELIDEVVRLHNAGLYAKELTDLLGITYYLYRKILKFKGLDTDKYVPIELPNYVQYRIVGPTHKKHEIDDPPSDRQKWAFKYFTKIKIKDDTKLTFFELSDLMVAINKHNGYYRGEGFKNRVDLYMYFRNRINELQKTLNDVIKRSQIREVDGEYVVSTGVKYAHTYLIFKRDIRHIQILYNNFLYAYPLITSRLRNSMGNMQSIKYLYADVNIAEVIAYDYRMQRKIFSMFIDYMNFLGYKDIYYLTYLEIK